jgi:hypothetical protein
VPSRPVLRHVRACLLLPLLRRPPVHHSLRCFDDIIPVPLDAAGRPAFPTCYPGSADPIPAFVPELMAAEDDTTPLRTDSYCLACMVTFCSGSDSCYHHRRICWCRC